MAGSDMGSRCFTWNSGRCSTLNPSHGRVYAGVDYPAIIEQDQDFVLLLANASLGPRSRRPTVQ